MNTKLSTIKQSPLLYLALIPVVTLLVTLSWRMATGSKHLYVQYDNPLQSQLALTLSGIICLLILVLSLKIKQCQTAIAMNNQPMLHPLLSIGAAGLMAVVMYICLFEIVALTGMLFASLCFFLVAMMMLSIRQNRWFYSSFSMSIIIIPIIKLLSSYYLVRRLSDVFFSGSSTDRFYYPVVENLHNSALFDSSTEAWRDVPAYYGQMTVLKLIHNVGYVPALLLVGLVLGAWIFAAIKIYQAQNANRFWQQLAYYLALFFIIEAVINVLGNLNILKTVFTTNIMPFSSNGGLWVLFIAFGFACWRMRIHEVR